MYKYYQSILFLVLIRKLTKSQTFIPDWPKLGNIRAEYGLKRVENVILMSQ